MRRVTTINSATSASSARHELMADAGHILLLAVLCVVFFWRLITPFDGQRMFMESGDFVNQFYPYHQFVASELRQGRIPLWDPFILAGHPAFADPQMSTSYPIGLLLDFALGGGGLTLYGVELRAIFHYFLAAAFAYLLVKRLTGTRYAGLLAGITFALGGYMLSYPGQQAPLLESAAWLPLTLLFIDCALDGRKFQLTYLSLAGATEGMAILAGHTQTAMFSLYVGMLYTLYLVNKQGPAIRQTVAACACFGLVSASTSAIGWVPGLEFVPLSTRAHLSYTAAGHGFEFSSVLGAVLPNWRNEKSLYLGIAPLLLALLAASRRRPGSVFWVALAGGAILLSFGRLTPFFALLFAVAPGFAMFKDQERIALVYVLATSVLTGFGVKEIIGKKGRESALERAKFLALPIVIISLSAIIPFFTAEWQTSTAFQTGLYGGLFSGYELMLVLIIIAVSLLTLALNKIGLSVLPAIAIVAFVVLDLFVINWNDNIRLVSTGPSSDAVATMDYIKSLPGIFRIRLENDEVLPSNYPAMFGLAHIGGDTPIRLARVERLLESTNEWKLWQLFNVDFAVTRRQFDDGVQLVHTQGNLNTYKVSYGLPRAYAVTEYKVATDSEDAYRLTTSPDLHPGDVAILEEQPSLTVPAPGSPRPEVVITDYSPQRIEMRTSGSVDAMLIVADAYYPGWRATIDGNRTDIHTADYALRAIELPKGEHLVEMVFDPQSYKIGAAVSMLAWLGIALLAVARWRRRAG